LVAQQELESLRDEFIKLQEATKGLVPARRGRSGGAEITPIKIDQGAKQSAKTNTAARSLAATRAELAAALAELADKKGSPEMLTPEATLPARGGFLVEFDSPQGQAPGASLEDPWLSTQHKRHARQAQQQASQAQQQQAQQQTLGTQLQFQQVYQLLKH
jgi:hypothetical protein